MTQPTRGDVHVSRALTNISVAYMQQATDFVSMTAFPAVPVEFRSDEYFVFDSADFRRNNAKPRAPGTESAGGGFDIDTATYTCEVYAEHKDVPDQIRSNSDPAIDMDRSAATFVMEQLMIQKEVNWTSSYFTTGIWDSNVTGGTDFTQWDDAASDPETDVDAGKAGIKQKTGLNANTLIVGYPVHQALKRHPIVTDRFKHTSSDSITATLLARFFEVDRYLVAGASYTTSQEGAAAETNAFIAGKHALLAYVAPAPGLLVPSAGYTFAWRAFSGANGGVRTKNFRMEHLEADRIEGEFAYDHKAVLTSAGYFFNTATA
jgi:hypothetical protein